MAVIYVLQSPPGSSYTRGDMADEPDQAKVSLWLEKGWVEECIATADGYERRSERADEKRPAPRTQMMQESKAEERVEPEPVVRSAPRPARGSKPEPVVLSDEELGGVVSEMTDDDLDEMLNPSSDVPF